MSKEERRIIDRILHGHDEDFRQLTLPYEQEQLRFILRLEPNKQEAEELKQDTLLKAFHRLKDYRGEATLQTWLLGIAYRTVVSHLRKHPPRTVYFEDDEKLMAQVEENDVDESLNLYTEEQIDKLMKAIDMLPPQDRTVITEFYLEDRPMKEIAQMLDIEYSTAVTRLHRIRKKLYLIIKKM